MYKERNDDHFYFGPVWDFDIAFDNDGFVYPINNKKQFSFEYGHSRGGTSKFIEKILVNKNIIKKIKHLWKYVFENQLKDNYLITYIDELVKKINESQRLNFIRWKILDKVIETRNPIIKFTYENEIMFLKKFVESRIRWMNKYILDDKLYDIYINNNSEFVINKYKFIVLIQIFLF